MRSEDLIREIREMMADNPWVELIRERSGLVEWNSPLEERHQQH